MNSENFSQFFSKKAYEIAYAAIRISAVLKEKIFSDSLLEQALSFLDLSTRGKYEECRQIATSMDYVFRLGSDTGFIHPANAQVMIAELEQFNAAIAEYKKLTHDVPIAPIDDLFSKLPVAGSVPAISENQQKEDENFFLDDELELSPEERQSAILEIIRQQSGNVLSGRFGCRLKDIQDALHEGSERTIRYDIQNLIERGLVERVGSGASTYYKVKIFPEDSPKISS